METQKLTKPQKLYEFGKKVGKKAMIAFASATLLVSCNMKSDSGPVKSDPVKSDSSSVIWENKIIFKSWKNGKITREGVDRNIPFFQLSTTAQTYDTWLYRLLNVGKIDSFYMIVTTMYGDTTITREFTTKKKTKEKK